MRRPTLLQSLIRSEPARVAQLAAGMLLMIVGPILGAPVPLPIPIGMISFGLGLALVLRNSGWARRRYVRWKRRYPRAGRLTEFGLQRRKRRSAAPARPADGEQAN